MYDYVRYVGRIADNKKKGLHIKEAVDEAVNWAVEQDLLDGFFKVYKAEVSAMCLTEYDEEATLRAFRREGYEDGLIDGKLEAARNFIAEGVSPETVAKCTGLPLDEVQKLAKQVAANV